jgi:hypothetical protein
LLVEGAAILILIHGDRRYAEDALHAAKQLVKGSSVGAGRAKAAGRRAEAHVG